MMLLSSLESLTTGKYLSSKNAPVFICMGILLSDWSASHLHTGHYVSSTKTIFNIDSFNVHVLNTKIQLDA